MYIWNGILLVGYYDINKKLSKHIHTKVIIIYHDIAHFIFCILYLNYFHY